tara:strand:- start:4 stop:1245 length:1242 start_codon:yes stop_codon:yes gene_type:complete
MGWDTLPPGLRKTVLQHRAERTRWLQRMTQHAEDLHRYGAVVVPVFADDAERATWEERVWQAMDGFPEYKRTGKHVQRVLGGFGALGNPASFHHPTVQALRVKVKREVSTPLFTRFRRRARLRLEVLFDRLCVRAHDFGNVTKEAWHRDIYDGPKYGLRTLPPEDEIFGGWINLSAQPQRFVGLLGSHAGPEAREAQRRGGGFAELSEAQIRAEKVGARLAAQAERTFGSVRADANGHLVVPPGHMLVFFQRLLHSVAGGKQPTEPQLRLFFGHRLTTETTPLFPLDGVLANNAVPRIPSGQVPPMYSTNHYAFFSKDARYRSKEARYREWGDLTFQPQCLFRRQTPKGVEYFTPGSADDRDVQANLKRTMPSLAAMGFAPYPYTAQTRAALTPEDIDDYGWDGETDVVMDED